MPHNVCVEIENRHLRRAKERWRQIFLIVKSFEDSFEWKMLFRARGLHSLQLSFNRAAVHFEPFFIIGFGNGFFAVPASLGLMKLPGFVGGAGCTPPPVASR
jgi:hypothetical protein